jgi:hypothetical protein
MADMEKPFGHETDAVALKKVVVIMVVLALIVVASVIGIHYGLSESVTPNQGALAARPGRIPPPPRLQAHPHQDLAQFRAHEQSILTTYAWAGGNNHYARIPIKRAMQIYAQQHASAASASSSKPPARRK